MKDVFVLHYIPPQVKPDSKKILVCHGFPSHVIKNNDVAEFLTLAGNEVFILHYSGLGMSKGSFTFTKSITEAEELLKLINDKVTVIGHSWGGFVALNLLQRNTSVEKLILLSPFTNLPEINFVEEFTSYVLTNFKDDLVHLQKDEVKNNISELMRNYSLKSLFSTSAGEKIKIFQADDDDVVSRENTDRFVNSFSKVKPQITYCEENHLFAKKRSKVLKQILESL